MERVWSFGDRLSVTVTGYEIEVPFVRTYGEASQGEYLATVSSSGFLEVARREGSVAEQLGVSPGAAILVGKAGAKP